MCCHAAPVTVDRERAVVNWPPPPAVADDARVTDEPRGESDVDALHLRSAIALSRNCTPSGTAFSVGALVVDATGEVIATGWSRRSDPREHAEEAALAELPPGDGRLAGATLYSSLEPCSTRASRERSCTRLILDPGVRRVVFAWREPAVFVDCRGAELLRDAGVEVVELAELACAVREVNAHLSTSPGRG